MEKEILTRSDAITAGKSKYFTGKRCKNGHLSERYVVSCGCCECLNYEQTSRRIAIRQQRQRQAVFGVHPITVMAHPDDVDTILAIAGELTKAREEKYRTSPERLAELEAFRASIMLKMP